MFIGTRSTTFRMDHAPSSRYKFHFVGRTRSERIERALDTRGSPDAQPHRPEAQTGIAAPDRFTAMAEAGHRVEPSDTVLPLVQRTDDNELQVIGTAFFVG
ncbi:MAG: hypothetical protein RXR52_44555, partial [Paraburkholderia sp.]|uniref:hypothetical protein n=1 Tax=Paraburkholderia sp. TaxID=1926495 RepID=UPI00397C88D8